MAFTVNGPKWKSVRLEGKPGYWILVDDNDSPIDLDEQGNIRVYSSKTDKNPQFGRIRLIGGILREQDDKVAADRVRREADKRAMNSGAWKFANAISYAPYVVTLPMAAEIAPVFAPGSTFWMNPITQRMVTGTAMAKGFDAATKLGTGYNSWGEGVSDLVNKATGWNPQNSWWGKFLADATNPGWGMNPSRIMNPIGKIGNAIETGVNKAMTLYNSPLTGKWTTIGGRLYRLSPAAGANRVGVESEPLSNSNTVTINGLQIPAELKPRTISGNRIVITDPKTGKTFIYDKYLENNGLMVASSKKFTPLEFELLINSGELTKPEQLYLYMPEQDARDIFKIAMDIKKKLGKFSFSNIKEDTTTTLVDAILARAGRGHKGVRGTKADVQAAREAVKNQTVEGEYNSYLNNKDALALEEIRAQIAKDYGTQIQFNEFSGEKLASDNIPQAVAIAPIEVPGVGKVPLMQRYIYNARQRAEQLFPDLVHQGYMFVDPKTKMWMGSYTPEIEKSFQPIDPAMFVLSFVKNIRNSSNRVPVFREYSRAGNRDLVLPIAWHGTPTGDANLLTLYASPTDIKSIFATVSDGMPGSSNVKAAYQRGGTSIPFLFKRKSYNGRTYLEEPYHPLLGGGNKSTGYILDDGTNIGLLIDHFGGGKGGGTARYVYDVSDLTNIPHNSAQPQTEYIFGVGTPEVKSVLNTGDYLPYFDEEGKLIEGVTPFNKRGGRITINNLILC